MQPQWNHQGRWDCGKVLVRCFSCEQEQVRHEQTSHVVGLILEEVLSSEVVG